MGNCVFDGDSFISPSPCTTEHIVPIGDSPDGAQVPSIGGDVSDGSI